MKQKMVITTLAIFFVTSLSLSANAFQGSRDGYCSPVRYESGDVENGWRGKNRQFRQAMVSELLELTEGQQEQIKIIREEERSASEAMREKMQEYREQMRELTDSGTFDEEAIRAIATEKAKIQTDLTVSRARMHSKVHAVMTPDQQELAEKLRSLKHKKRGRHQRGFGRGWQSDFD